MAAVTRAGGIGTTLGTVDARAEAARQLYENSNQLVNPVHADPGL
jgi:hypothetical protein